MHAKYGWLNEMKINVWGKNYQFSVDHFICALCILIKSGVIAIRFVGLILQDAK